MGTWLKHVLCRDLKQHSNHRKIPVITVVLWHFMAYSSTEMSTKSVEEVLFSSNPPSNLLVCLSNWSARMGQSGSPTVLLPWGALQALTLLGSVSFSAASCTALTTMGYSPGKAHPPKSACRGPFLVGAGRL